ncbi:hypothetical protein Tco_0438864 [Tanacetum coccineum]
MVMRTQPTLSPGMSARIAEAAALSLSSFRGELGEEDTEEDESSDVDDERESQGLDDEGHGLGDESQGLEDEGLSLEEEEEEEEAAPEGQQQVVLVVDTAMSEPLGLGYRAARRRTLESIDEISPSTYEVGQSSRSVPEKEGVERIFAFRQPTLVTWVDPKDGRVYTDIPAYSPPAAPVQAPPSPEWSLGSLPVSPSFPIVPSPIASPVAIPIATISRLDALPPTLVTDIDRDVRELYTRSGVVKDEIFSQRYRFRSLERKQERTVVTFGALYDDHRLIHDMLIQQAVMQCEFQEMRGRVAALEQVKGNREPYMV